MDCWYEQYMKVTTVRLPYFGGPGTGGAPEQARGRIRLDRQSPTGLDVCMQVMHEGGRRMTWPVPRVMWRVFYGHTLSPVGSKALVAGARDRADSETTRRDLKGAQGSRCRAYDGIRCEARATPQWRRLVEIKLDLPGRLQPARHRFVSLHIGHQNDRSRQICRLMRR